MLQQLSNPEVVFHYLESAEPLRWRSPLPERVEVEVPDVGEGYVLLTQLDDPEWRAVWRGPSGERPATIVRLFVNESGAGWQGVRVPGPGRWTLRLVYRGRAAAEGLAVSGVAWLGWFLAYWWVAKRQTRLSALRAI